MSSVAVGGYYVSVKDGETSNCLVVALMVTMLQVAIVLGRAVTGAANAVKGHGHKHVAHSAIDAAVTIGEGQAVIVTVDYGTKGFVMVHSDGQIFYFQVLFLPPLLARVGGDDLVRRSHKLSKNERVAVVRSGLAHRRSHTVAISCSVTAIGV